MDDVERVAQCFVEASACEFVEVADGLFVEGVERDGDDVVATDDARFGQAVFSTEFDFGSAPLGADPEVRFLGDLAASSLSAEPVAASDWMRIAELVAQCADLSLGTVDASVIAAAEPLGISEIATLDRRHFTVVQSNIGTFNLLP